MNVRIRVWRRSWWALGLAVATLVVSGARPAAAQTAEDQGLAIALEADRRARGYGDFSARLTMVLRSRDGKERKRELRVRGLELAGHGSRTLVVFMSPRDLAGTALLTFSQPGEGDEQWLYLPALKRVKRLAASDRSGSFMGSEFAYEDINSQEVGNFTYHYLHDDTIAGGATFVIERRPLYQSSGYSRQVVWLDKAEYRPLRIDYYDRRGELLKTLELRGYRQHAGRYWRAGEMIMANHQNGRTSLLAWTDFEFGVGMTEREFDPGALARVW